MMQGISNNSNKDLLNAIAAGSEDAYRVLFERYWDHIYSATLLLTKSPEISEDVTQDVFTMVWEKRGSLTDIDNLEGFLFVSARNNIYSRLRKLSTQDTYQEYLKNYIKESSQVAGEEQIYSRDLEQRVKRAVSHLPPQQQKAFRLSRFEGLAHDEIASLMGVSRVTVKSYIVQALATLRKILSGSAITVLTGALILLLPR